MLCAVEGKKKKKRDPTFSEVTAHLPLIFVGLLILSNWTHWDNIQGELL